MGLPTFQGLEIAKSGMMAYNTAKYKPLTESHSHIS